MRQILGILLIIFIILFWRGGIDETSSSERATSGFAGFLKNIQTQTTQNILRITGSSEPAQIAPEALGEYSPYYGKITIEKGLLSSLGLGTRATHVADEYIALRASRTNTAPINITGWSIASMVSGKTYYISGGAKIFAMGAVNNAEAIYLAPGERVVISTGQSPLGVSFKENMCTGYLNSTQYFEPPLTSRCPIPSSVLPPTVHNIQTFGDACIAFAERFPRCNYLTSTTRGIDSLEPLCQEFLKRVLTYTTCVDEYKDAVDFSGDTWRVFLGSATEIWRNEYEIIRLADENGRTVDVTNY